jgi:VanZ family protein
VLTTPASRREPDGRQRRAPVFFALLAVAWMGMIFWVSSGPVPPVVPDQFLDLVVKKAGHFSAYALLAVLWWLALRGRVTPRVALVAAFAIAAAYAGSDELHQAFSPTRHPSLVDVGIDALGAAAGLLVIVRWVPRRQGPPGSG